MFVIQFLKDTHPKETSTWVDVVHYNSNNYNDARRDYDNLTRTYGKQTVRLVNHKTSITETVL